MKAVASSVSHKNQANLNVLGQEDQRGLGSFVRSASVQQQLAANRKKDRQDSIAEYTLLKKFCREKRIAANTTQKGATNCKYSLGELKCDAELARLGKNEKAVCDARLAYQYANHAHHAFHQLLGDKPCFSSRKLSDLIEQRQFGSNQRDAREVVPRAQRATTMWARSFGILEKITEAEQLYGNLKLIFHDKNSAASRRIVKRTFCCRDRCLDVLTADNPQRIESLHRLCVAPTLFDQFYVPICFARRNALHPETNLSDRWSKTWSMERPADFADQLDYVDKQNLFDIQFLTLSEALQLCLQPLQHPAGLFAFPVQSLQTMQFNQAEREDWENAVKKGRKTGLFVPSADSGSAVNDLHTSSANAETYNKRPEKMEDRCPHGGDKWRELALDARERQIQRQQQQDADDLEWERLLRQRDREAMTAEQWRAAKMHFFERYATRDESTRDGVHNRFSSERIEMFQTVLNIDKQQVSATCARYNTKHRPYSTESVDSAREAVRKFVGTTDAAVADLFEQYCAQNRSDILAESGAKRLCFDRTQTLRLYACFLMDGRSADSAALKSDERNRRSLSALIGKQLASEMRRLHVENMLAQLKTPNFRAWSACLLQQLDRWLDRLLQRVLRPSAEWADYVSASGADRLAEQPPLSDEQPHSNFADFEHDCVSLLPWLFYARNGDERDSLLQFNVESKQAASEESRRRRAIDCQFEANCAKHWPTMSAVEYLNRKIMAADVADIDASPPYNSGAGECRRAADRTTSFRRTLSDVDTLVQRSLLRSPDLDKQPELANLMRSEQKMIDENRRAGALWTLCCEPLEQGSARFSINRDNEKYCPRFGIGKRRDADTTNPYVQFHSFVWSVFRREWNVEKHKHMPHVASFADSVVGEYANITNRSLSPVFYNRDNPYLLVSNAKHFDCRHGERQSATVADHDTASQIANSSKLHIASHMRGILRQFERHVWQPRLRSVSHRNASRVDLVELTHEPREVLRESETFVRETLAHDARHELPCFADLYRYSRPYATLQSFMQRERLRRRQRKERAAISRRASMPSVVVDSAVKPSKRSESATFAQIENVVQVAFGSKRKGRQVECTDRSRAKRRRSSRLSAHEEK